jgi:type IV pilus assembly protein PilA
MRTFLKSLRRQEGFTLVELMVVVGIIGLLSAIAIPNFKKYQARAKISEAKLQLSSLYTAEQSFWSDYNMYATCLRYMGFDPAREMSNRYYAVGFPVATSQIDSAVYASAVNLGLLTADCPDTGAALDGSLPANWLDRTADFYSAGKSIGNAIVSDPTTAAANAAGVLAADCTKPVIELVGVTSVGVCIGDQSIDDNMTFQAAAVGYISAEYTSDGSVASGLNINHNKLIKSVVTGY